MRATPHAVAPSLLLPTVANDTKPTGALRRFPSLPTGLSVRHHKINSYQQVEINPGGGIALAE
jgi:hypothetical protein